ncbi:MULTISPECIES: TIGR03089 family protein [Arthrobacter]|uniref:TIGR03089 family protein n=2 Tax=Arthrobacter TaxID=1663 RepID=A0ABU9KKP2_9MICC|nr:TIGR03089 family protein [Arthrobacter sp. YJM1]MDP5227366.1 TIGR03089 family protein [Arthrobacter sp. YJM1]
MTTVLRSLLQDFREGRTLPSGAPRLTWYGPGGERVELSGKVLDNWVAKSGNLLQDELDGGPGVSISLALPAHWKSFVLVLAAMDLGMLARLDGDALEDADMTATADEALVGRAGEVDTQLIAVALGALSPRWPGELPSGVVDYAGAVRGHGDVFQPWMDADPTQAVLSTGGREIDDAGLRTFATEAADGVRLLVHAGDGLPAALAAALGAWLAGGSVVLVHPEVDVTPRLRESEKISA